MSRRVLKTEDDLRHELEKVADTYKSDAEAARAFGVSRSHFSRVLRGEKTISDKIALGLGYERQARFVPYEQRD
jgi:plasmid maintenance system antidote protein VapI